MVEKRKKQPKLGIIASSSTLASNPYGRGQRVFISRNIRSPEEAIKIGENLAKKIANKLSYKLIIK